MTIRRTAFAMLGLVLALPSIGAAATGDSANSTTATENQSQNAPPSEAAPPTSTGLRTLFRDLGGDFKHLPSIDSAIVASIGGGLALGLHPLDNDVNQHLARDGAFFKAGDLAGNTVTLMAASTTAYGLGRALGDNRIAHVGLDLLRAQIVTEAMVQSLKFTVERPRPDGSAGYSFPSGHAAVTFATATVLDRHLPWRFSLPAYALAAYVATSRLHDNVHNLSDVVFGAAVGTIAGRTITRHGASSFVLVPQATRGGFGVLLARTSKSQ
jgi:membrane-associated phospholipid phosphatase